MARVISEYMLRTSIAPGAPTRRVSRTAGLNVGYATEPVNPMPVWSAVKYNHYRHGSASRLPCKRAVERDVLPGEGPSCTEGVCVFGSPPLSFMRIPRPVRTAPAGGPLDPSVRPDMWGNA